MSESEYRCFICILVVHAASARITPHTTRPVALLVGLIMHYFKGAGQILWIRPLARISWVSRMFVCRDRFTCTAGNYECSVDGRPKPIINRAFLKQTIFSIHAVVLEIQRTKVGALGLLWAYSIWASEIGVPNREVVDTMWGLLRCSIPPQRWFCVHIVQGWVPATCDELAAVVGKGRGPGQFPLRAGVCHRE